jgi:hypothetical protein
MKKLLCVVIFAFGLSIAKEYGVYDVQGNLLLRFEAEPHELPQKIEQAKSAFRQKNVFVSVKDKMVVKQKPAKLYGHKTGLLSYIETEKNEIFSVCPEKHAEGTWASDYSISITQDNCVALQSPPVTGTFYLAFINASGRIDTTQVLVNQAYIDMSKYSHKVWKRDPKDKWKGDYEPYEYTQPLVVDKTEVTMAEAHYFSQSMPTIWLLEYYPKGENVKNSQRPYLNSHSYNLARERSKRDGFSIVYRDSINSKELDVFPSSKGCFKNEWAWKCTVIDTNSTGYRLPTVNEWAILTRAGASTKYYWGDAEDSATVSKYAWVRPRGYPKPVAQLQPNQFGLYDMVSPNNPYVDKYEPKRADYDQACSPRYSLFQQSPECHLQSTLIRRMEYMGYPTSRSFMIEFNEDGSFKSPAPKAPEPSLQKLEKEEYSKSIRFLRKSPKMERLEKL